MRDGGDLEAQICTVTVCVPLNVPPGRVVKQELAGHLAA
jgi:hypothetical protein